MRVKKVWLSHAVSESTPAFGGGEGFGRETLSSISKGSSCNTEKWVIPNHTGTHVDFPLHFFDSAPSCDDYPPEFWTFRFPHLIEIPLEAGRLITPEDGFDSIPDNVDILLIKTGFQNLRSHKSYWEDNPGIHPDVATLLREKRPSMRAIGFDFISVSRFKDRAIGREAHKRFLSPATPGDPVLIIEDMDLAEVDVRTKWNAIHALPFRVSGADGTFITIIGDVK